MRRLGLMFAFFLCIQILTAQKTDSLFVKDYKYKQFEEILCNNNLRTLLIVDYRDTILPESIGDLINLEYLEIKSSNIKTLPKSIANLKALKTLIIANGWGKIIIPKQIGELKNLKVFKIYNHHFEKLPDEIGNLSELRDAMICGDLIDLPESFSKLNKLRYLYMEGNKFKKIPSSLLKLKQLESLVLSRNEITYINDSIKLLKNLKSLLLYDNVKIDKLPESICELKNLKELDISNTQISCLPDCLSENDSLKKIKLCKILFDNPQEIENTYRNKVKWERNCWYLKSELVDFDEIYGNYSTILKKQKDTVILECRYFYNEPNVLDEEYTWKFTIKIIDKKNLELNKVYSITNSNFKVDVSYFNIWVGECKETVEGYIQIIEFAKNKCVAYLKINKIKDGISRNIINRKLNFDKENENTNI